MTNTVKKFVNITATTTKLVTKPPSTSASATLSKTEPQSSNLTSDGGGTVLSRRKNLEGLEGNRREGDTNDDLPSLNELNSFFKDKEDDINRHQSSPKRNSKDNEGTGMDSENDGDNLNPAMLKDLIDRVKDMKRKREYERGYDDQRGYDDGGYRDDQDRF